MPAKSTTEQFIQKATHIHGNKYCYSDTIYVDRLTKVKITCRKCGTMWQPTPHQHLYMKHGCPNCAHKMLAKRQTMTHEQFVAKARRRHGDEYEYLGKYIDSHTKIMMRHVRCGHVFAQIPNNHTSLGAGCPKCGQTTRALAATRTQAEFLRMARKVHGGEYEYLAPYRGEAAKMRMRHKPCGHIFEQRASVHLRGSGCPLCSASDGERMIKQWLEDHKIPFIFQHRFDDCVNPATNRKLKFDFYLPLYSTAIEFDGLQHYKPISFYGSGTEVQADEAFSKTRMLDKIKNDYCIAKGIELVRICAVHNEIDHNVVSDVLLEVIK